MNAAHGGFPKVQDKAHMAGLCIATVTSKFLTPMEGWVSGT